VTLRVVAAKDDRISVKRFPFALAAVAAAALLLAAYANSLHNSFHFDDSHVITNNLFLRSLRNIPRFFTDAHTFSSLPQNATYRPLVTLSLALDYAVGGLDPLVFHVTQIVLLLLIGVLLVIFFTPILPSPMSALFAATLFCVHTANTETMNLISARSELLSAIGLLGSFVLFQRSPFARRTLLYLLPLAVGALAKAPVVVFAPLLFVYVVLFEGQPPRRAARTALPSLVLGVVLLVFLSSMNATEWSPGGGSRLHYLITQPFVWLHYFRLFFLPIGLTADTDWQPFARWYDFRALAGYAFVVLLAIWMRRASRTAETRPVAFGLAWFTIALLPTSSFFPLAEVANEHRVFFAYIGLVLAVVCWIRFFFHSSPFTLHSSKWRVALVPAALAILAAHATGTHARNEVWATEETLWRDVLAKSPANGRAWMNYGLTQMEQGRFGGAKNCFDRAAVLTPNYSILEINRGIVSGALGDQSAAEAHFQRALVLNSDANAHFFYARWLVKRNRGPEAIEHLQAALRLSPAYADVRALLMRLYAAKGDGAALHDLVTDTLRVDPANAIAHRLASGGYAPDGSPAGHDALLRYGLAAMQRDDYLSAALACRAALKLDPRSVDAWNNLGSSLAGLGFREEARHAYQNALSLRPDDPRTRNNLALLG
jgi:tetratricopeptide (TPR) repeat protein